MRLVFATNNAHKLEEVRRILPPTCAVISLREAGMIADIPETGTTLDENSRQKAEAVCQWLKANGQWPNVDGVFADDTGLEVEALNGAPGVYSARYAGEPANDANNRAKLIGAMEGIANRRARFRTVVTLIRGERIDRAEGIVWGRILPEERGNNGFGYDRLFVPQEEDENGRGRTFAEMGEDEKNEISHRARAIAAMQKVLEV
ncbi:MAG: RdgB/HAM1 family non-canonical purine NTP pyrophosphatase [Paludibacteraceae bacterium]|nr:RdgB/HAM1 family non-canonical purine NTP pyrophosphatase [Paludibacteraceae bacterium]